MGKSIEVLKYLLEAIDARIDLDYDYKRILERIGEPFCQKARDYFFDYHQIESDSANTD